MSSQCFLLGKVTLVFRQSGRWFFMFYTESQRTIRYMLLKSMTPAICPLRAMPICIKLHIKRGGIPSCAENGLNWCPFLSSPVHSGPFAWSRCLSFIGFYGLVLVGHCLHTAGVTGSIPVAPTILLFVRQQFSVAPRIRCLVPSSVWHKSGTRRHHGDHQKARQPL